MDRQDGDEEVAKENVYMNDCGYVIDHTSPVEADLLCLLQTGKFTRWWEDRETILSMLSESGGATLESLIREKQQYEEAWAELMERVKKYLLPIVPK